MLRRVRPRLYNIRVSTSIYFLRTSASTPNGGNEPNDSNGRLFFAWPKNSVSTRQNASFEKNHLRARSCVVTTMSTFLFKRVGTGYGFGRTSDHSIHVSLPLVYIMFCAYAESSKRNRIIITARPRSSRRLCVFKFRQGLKTSRSNERAPPQVSGFKPLCFRVSPRRRPYRLLSRARVITWDRTTGRKTICCDSADCAVWP